MEQDPPALFRPLIIDTTLRDGEQTPGLAFSMAEKIHLASMLLDAGVDEIEAGIPVMGGEESRYLRHIAKSLPKERIFGWCRLHEKDLQAAQACGMKRIHMAFPVSTRQLRVLGWDKAILETRLETLLPLALSRFEGVSLGFQDATRTPVEDMLALLEKLKGFPIRRIRISDTVGVASPLEISRIIERLKEKSPFDLEFHGHNDLGMATANALTALESGAKAVSLTVNGLGERAGNARLEELVMALTLKKIPHGVSTKALRPLSRHVAGLTGCPLPPDKPVTGGRVFTHESGIHCHGQLRDPLSFQPMEPEIHGLAPVRFMAGKHGGRASLVGESLLGANKSLSWVEG
jgi:homocitrate synthase NifV